MSKGERRCEYDGGIGVWSWRRVVKDTGGT
jgi:hypothetical protein